MDILIYLVSAASCPHKLYERKKNNIAMFHGIKYSKPSSSVWPWDVTGNPKHWRRVSQMQRHFRGSLCGFPGSSYGKKKSTLNVGDPGQPLGREVPLEIGKGNGYPLQYSCLENTMDRRTWQVTVHRVAKSQTRLSTYTPSLPSFPHRVTLRFPNHH